MRPTLLAQNLRVLSAQCQLLIFYVLDMNLLTAIMMSPSGSGGEHIRPHNARQYPLIPRRPSFSVRTCTSAMNLWPLKSSRLCCWDTDVVLIGKILCWTRWQSPVSRRRSARYRDAGSSPAFSIALCGPFLTEVCILNQPTGSSEVSLGWLKGT